MSAAAPAVQACEKCLCPGDAKVGTPVGKIVEYAGVQAYVTGSSKEHAVIYSTDVWGFEFTKHQLLADQFAAAGLTVIIPNTLNDQMDITNPTSLNEFPQWLARNPVTHATEIAVKVVEVAAKEFKTVFAIGFCYGARAVMDIVTKRPELLKAAVVCHPTFLAAADAPAVKLPMLFNCAEKDDLFSPELKAVFEGELKNVAGCKLISYPGTNHGFTVRGQGEVAQAAAAEAAVNTIAFFNENK